MIGLVVDQTESGCYLSVRERRTAQQTCLNGTKRLSEEQINQSYGHRLASRRPSGHLLQQVGDCVQPRCRPSIVAAEVDQRSQEVEGRKLRLMLERAQNRRGP